MFVIGGLLKYVLVLECVIVSWYMCSGWKEKCCNKEEIGF